MIQSCYSNRSKKKGYIFCGQKTCKKFLIWHFVLGGCSNFGHSCFGGHGKRANGIGGGELEEMPAGGVGGAPYDQQLVFTGPRSAPLGDLVDDAAGGPPPTSYRELRLSPFLRQWVSNRIHRI